VLVSKIAVVGAGYVGLVSAACFARKGKDVIVVEKDLKKIAVLQEGRSPFYEPELDELVAQGIAAGRLTFVPAVKDALACGVEMIFLCVGTPSLFDGSVDLSAVREVASHIGEHINSTILVINKSTVPVGTASMVSEIISHHLTRRGVTVDFEVVSNPEFLKEGSAVEDSLKPDRVIVGVRSERARAQLHELYKPFITSDQQFLVMSPESCELTKYASNSMLATRISFMNQLARLADKLEGVDIEDVRRGMGFDKRIGPDFLRAGIGYGGSCFPKDVKALIDMGKRAKQPMTLLEQVDDINREQRLWFISLIKNHYKEALAQKRVGVLGLSFKPNTDDIREAPSLDIITFLCKAGCDVTVYDPVAHENVQKEYEGMVRYARSCKEVLRAADFLILLTEWPMFLKISVQEFMELKDKTIFDGRNALNADELLANGFTYYSVGRNFVKRPSHKELLVEQHTAAARQVEL
jgi:UDPglucose 6-dehydrogenase